MQTLEWLGKTDQKRIETPNLRHLRGCWRLCRILFPLIFGVTMQQGHTLEDGGVPP